ncbi:MAG: tetratricopeptide repeat protein [Verrucomicrobiales bacterium]
MNASLARSLAAVAAAVAGIFAALPLANGAPKRDSLIPIDESFYKDPRFVQEFLGEFGARAEVEPTVSPEEMDVFRSVLDLMQTDEEAAKAQIKGILGPNSSAALFVVYGNLLFKQDKLEEARTAYEIAIKKHPKFLRAHKMLGFIHLKEQRYKEAEDHLRKAVTLGDQEPRVYGLLGVCYLRSDDKLGAETAFRQANLLEPDNPQWRDGLLNALITGNKFAEANAILNGILNEDPTNDKYWGMLAASAINAGDQMKAAEAFEVLRLLGKIKPADLRQLGDIYLNNDLGTPALNAYLGLLEQSPSLEVKPALRSAEVLLQFGMTKQASDFMNRLKVKSEAEEVSKEDRLAIRTLEAKVATSMGREDEAADIFKKVIEDDSFNGDALIALGKYLSRRGEEGDFGMAKIYLERAANIKEFEFEASLALGDAFVKRQSYTEALKPLKRALELKTGNKDNLEQHIRRVERAAKLQTSTDGK